MADDQTFRVVLALGLALVVPAALLHRLRSQATGEPLDRRQEGLVILLTLRPVGLAGLAGLLAFLWDPGLMAWSAVPLPVVARWSGVALGAVAGGLLVWTMGTLGPNLTDTVVTRRRHVLVTAGPYRYVRHPFYVAAALAVAAGALVTANGFIASTGVVALGLIVARTPIEEAQLVARFGDDYRAYMRRTNRFVPRRPRPGAAGSQR